MDFDSLKGKTLIRALVNKDKTEVHLYDNEGMVYILYHDQDCCETVLVEDVIGDLSDLLNTPLTFAEESGQTGSDEQSESFTWTFYKLATKNGYVDIRFYGSSNGYYSESVYMRCEVDPEHTVEKIKYDDNIINYVSDGEDNH